MKSLLSQIYLIFSYNLTLTLKNEQKAEIELLRHKLAVHASSEYDMVISPGS